MVIDVSHDYVSLFFVTVGPALMLGGLVAFGLYSYVWQPLKRRYLQT